MSGELCEVVSVVRQERAVASSQRALEQRRDVLTARGIAECVRGVVRGMRGLASREKLRRHACLVLHQGHG